MQGAAFLRKAGPIPEGPQGTWAPGHLGVLPGCHHTQELSSVQWLSRGRLCDPLDI